MKKTKKEMTFTELIKENPEMASILLEQGMPCAGCPLAGYETLEQGSKAHGIDVNELLKKLEKKKKK
jgi:hybrid cluster-associated redox disulfide protein